MIHCLCHPCGPLSLSSDVSICSGSGLLLYRCLFRYLQLLLRCFPAHCSWFFLLTTVAPVSSSFGYFDRRTGTGIGRAACRRPDKLNNGLSKLLPFRQSTLTSRPPKIKIKPCEITAVRRSACTQARPPRAA